MCATFQLAFDNDIEELKEIAGQLTAKYGKSAKESIKGDFFPKMKAPALGPNGKISLFNWGFPREGSKDVIFNARGESIAIKPLFSRYLGNRCLIPATAFYEWGYNKQKYTIAFEGLPLFYMAALWRPVVSSDGTKFYCFVIITTEPNAEIGRIHSRMPAIIRPEFRSDWFSGEAPHELLIPFDCKTIISAA